MDSIAFSDIACILVDFVGIWLFCNSIRPRNGCRRLAKSTHFEAENHADSVILQVALLIADLIDSAAAANPNGRLEAQTAAFARGSPS
ncbi:hypothetical protein, partial [Bradyrhizobium sp.]|uniref:hypothetical protein n=1 Tax=Bradyrhizobium sp. TaxID=376 RepID=UPI002E08E693|nr:hypothetical protein [Bradyrhizobium sp.]